MFNISNYKHIIHLKWTFFKLIGGVILDKKKSLLYSSGNVASGLGPAAFSTFVMFFYVDYLKMSPVLFGIGMMFYGIWNAINDPLFGQISDRTKTKRGRRIPYILFGSLPYAIAFILIWLPRPTWFKANPSMLFVYFMIAIFLYDGFYTLVILNWTALFPEMYKAQDERTRVSAYRQVFGIIGSILGTALTSILYKLYGWTAMAVIFGIISLIFLYISLLGSKEDPSYIEKGSLPFFKAIAETFKNKAFLSFVFMNTCLQFTFVLIEAVLPFYAKYVLKVDEFKTSALLATVFIVAMILVIPWAKAANRRGSKKTAIISMLMFGVSLIPFWFINSFTSGLITTAVVGIGLAGSIVLLDVFISDIVDDDEIKTGVRREGMYFGMNALVMRLGISAESLISGFMLKASGYSSSLAVGTQPQSAIRAMRELITIVPAAAIIIGILVFLPYPLHDQKLVEVKQKVEQLHSMDV